MKRCGSDDVENNNVKHFVYGSVFLDDGVGSITTESKKSKLFR